VISSLLIAAADTAARSGSFLSSPALPAILGVVGGLIIPAANWLGKRWRRTGRISSTDADTLWAERRAMGQELRDEIAGLRSELAAQRDETNKLRVELADRDARIRTLEAELKSVRRRLKSVEGESA
jgi:flagellar motility protein MotE (MotC chaperone)